MTVVISLLIVAHLATLGVVYFQSRRVDAATERAHERITLCFLDVSVVHETAMLAHARIDVLRGGSGRAQSSTRKEPSN